MKRFLGNIYFNIYSKWPNILKLFVFLMLVSIPIDIFNKLPSFRNILSAAWFIFIISIPYISEKPSGEK